MNSPLDSEFVEQQRRHLERLRAELLRASRNVEADERDLRESETAVAGEAEDDAQKLAALETDGTVFVREADRLARVDRALQKIAQGTYGVSDVSGLPIPRARLEAFPEANCLVEEQRHAEARRYQGIGDTNG